MNTKDDLLIEYGRFMHNLIQFTYLYQKNCYYTFSFGKASLFAASRFTPKKTLAFIVFMVFIGKAMAESSVPRGESVSAGRDL